jgi:hypothetical protein
VRPRKNPAAAPSPGTASTAAAFFTVAVAATSPETATTSPATAAIATTPPATAAVATTSTTAAVTATSAKAPHALEAGRNGEQHKQKRAEQPRLAFHGRLLFLATRAGASLRRCVHYIPLLSLSFDLCAFPVRRSRARLI